MPIILSLADRFCEAIILALRTDADITALAFAGIKHQPPETLNDFMQANQIFVWSVNRAKNLRPKPGAHANPIYSTGIMINLPSSGEAVPVGTPSPDSYMEHIEKRLELGSLADGSDQGKLRDPYAPGGASGALLYLNDKNPVFQSGQGVPVRNAEGNPTGITSWPLIVTYETTVARLTRLRG